MTQNKSYWTNFWKSGAICYKATQHEKVGRTIGGVPIRPELWQEILNDLEHQLQLRPADLLLDIGAGSGVISVPFSKKVNQVVALDVSERLLAEMQSVPGIETIEADALEIEFEAQRFNKIIIYFAIQHFSESETVHLIEKAFYWLKPGGILYVGDIPDTAHLFDFFNTPERRDAYFNSLLKHSPIIGTWFQKDFFLHLGRHAGFASTQIIEQPAHFINAHYRFDARFLKAGK